MSKIVIAIDGFMSHIYSIFNAIAAICLLFMMGSITYNVIGRIFNSSAGWTVEVSEYLMIVICFFTIGWILKMAGHVKIDLLTSLLNKKWKLNFQFISNFLGFLSSLFITYFAVLIVIDHMNRNIVLLKLLEVPKHWVLLPIMIGFLLLAIQFFRNVLQSIVDISRRKEGES